MLKYSGTNREFKRWLKYLTCWYGLVRLADFKGVWR